MQQQDIFASRETIIVARTGPWHGSLMTAPFRAALLTALALLTACASTGPQPVDDEARSESVFGAYLRGRYAAQAFDIPRAGRAFEEVSRRTDAPQGASTAFGYALASGDIEEAERQARLIVARRGDNPPDDPSIQSDLPALTLAAAAMKRGDEEEAAAILSGPMQSGLGRSLASLLRSAAVYGSGNLSMASEVLAQQPEGTFRGLIPLHAALLYQLEGDAESSEAAFQQALNAPRAEIAALGLARLYEDEGRPEDAEPIYRTLLQDSGLYARAGRMGLARIGRIEGVDGTFLRRARGAPPVARDAKGLFALGLEGYAWLGFDQAISIGNGDPRAEQLRRISLVIPLGLANLARHVDPSRDAADYLASIIFGVYDTPEASIEAARQVPPESWLYTYALLEVADAEADAGDMAAAADVLRRAIQAEGPDPQWALQLHLTLSEDERYEEADFYAGEAIKAAESLGVPEGALWRYYFSRGAVRVEAGWWPEGRDDLEKALAMAPDEPLILNYLGYSYVERGEQLERAFAMIERALAIDPQNGAIVDSLGWAHFQQGRYDEAVPLLEQAVGLEPADAVITDHLGDAYYAIGKRREARYEWRRVLELEDADDALKASVRAKLDGDFSDAPVLAELAAR
ncbi:tetratricopeptide repeat protein [Parvularcula maris]|uniref:Tetratricopeptide repeat protein n=1 Tax=Parvularcula maris TaxID=2965077 RepID=A0A9X2RJU8_9PROT|nr:tetratricopeptide repeat protein [Parvularcula maris]MCQ8185103.1 tetratricopeptide repeat protein [Parvularcula maris]